jgi:hypothetical protein
MKMADILRNIADLLDQTQDGNDGADLSNNRTQNRLDAVKHRQEHKVAGP